MQCCACGLRGVPGGQMHKDLVCGGPLRRRVGLNACIYQGPDSVWALLGNARRAQAPPQRPLLAHQLLRTRMPQQGVNDRMRAARPCGARTTAGLTISDPATCWHDSGVKAVQALDMLCSALGAPTEAACARKPMVEVLPTGGMLSI